MIKLLKNADLYTPSHVGKRDILIAGEKIMAIEPVIEGYDKLKGVEVFDLGMARVVPGLVDLHVHVTGGGGEQGPASRVPEIKLTDLTLNGVTTVLGLLGTDGITRSVENLVAKARALTEEGITCYCLTGSYTYPSVTAAGGVARDICLIDPVVGVKVAMADHRSSGITGQELIRLGSEARMGGLMAAKAGLVVIHMGTSKDYMNKLLYVMDNSDVPAKTYLPTHCERSHELIAQAMEFVKRGGTVDFTMGEEGDTGGAAKILYNAVEGGADPSRLTLSSDACGSLPRFDENGECIGLTYETPAGLLAEIRNLVKMGMPLETAMLFLTKNPARVLGKAGVKGELTVGADADILVFDDNLAVKTLFARGALAVRDGKAVMKGRFEI